MVAVEERNESLLPFARPTLWFDRFELNTATGQLNRGGVPVDLSPQLSKLLVMLAERPGQLITRKQIKEALWSGQAYGDFESRLNFTIEKLRAALDDDADEPRYIQTARNAGYRFIAPLRQEPPRPFVVATSLDHGQRDGLPEAALKTTEDSVPSARRRIGASEVLLVLLTVLVLAVAGTAILAVRRNQAAMMNQPPADKAEAGPEITSVTPILPHQRQSIVINGRGFGQHAPYKHTNSSYLAIRDQTANWAAGRGAAVQPNNDEVMVDVESWTDTEIALSGFSGDYGKNGWKLNPGDDIEFAIWNPQSGAGPALFDMRVNQSIP